VVSYTSNIIFLLLSKKDDQQESLEDWNLDRKICFDKKNHNNSLQNI
jgi:hypothetical protein